MVGQHRRGVQCSLGCRTLVCSTSFEHGYVSAAVPLAPRCFWVMRSGRLLVAGVLLLALATLCNLWWASLSLAAHRAVHRRTWELPYARSDEVGVAELFNGLAWWWMGFRERAESTRQVCDGVVPHSTLSGGGA